MCINEIHRKYIIHIAKHARSHKAMWMQHARNMKQHARVFFPCLCSHEFFENGKSSWLNVRTKAQNASESHPPYSAEEAPCIDAIRKRQSPSFQYEPPPTLRVAGRVPGSGKAKCYTNEYICMHAHFICASACIHTDLEIWTLIIEIIKRRNYQVSSNYI